MSRDGQLVSWVGKRQPNGFEIIVHYIMYQFGGSYYTHVISSKEKLSGPGRIGTKEGVND